MLVTTTFEIPGWEIQRVCGEVFGLTVRSRNVFSQMGAGFKSMFGGELQGMTKNLVDSRNEAMGRMLEAARAMSENKQAPQAIKLLRRVIRDHDGTQQAEAARKRLVDLGDKEDS